MGFISKLFGLNLKQSKIPNIQNFKSVGSFWEYFTKDQNWYNSFYPNQIDNLSAYITDLAPLIVQTTNELREKMEFSFADYENIMKWDNFLFENYEKENIDFKIDVALKFKQFCPNCKNEIGFNPRYPKALCRNCFSELTDTNGRKVEFFTLDYGCQGYFKNTEQQEKYNSDVCFIDDKEFLAEEARFGGIVIQLKK